MTTPSPPGFRPTHVVPSDGMPAWEAPDPAGPTVGLDPLLPVRLLDRRGDWGQVLCSNGWSAWVDGRLLVAVPQEPPAPGAPMARTADPRPLLARAEEALAGYRAAVEARAAGGLDGEAFRARTARTRLGLVVDGESLWLYDREHACWLYTDGTGLHTYATDTPPATRPRHSAGDAPVTEPRLPTAHAPSTAEAPEHAPTRLVPAEPVRAEPTGAPGNDDSEEFPRGVGGEPTRTAAPDPSSDRDVR